MAVFAADAVIDVEFPGLLCIARIKSMANKALRRMRCVGRTQARRAKDLRNPLGNGVIQDIPGTCVPILKHPGAVLVLQHARHIARLHSAMAGGGAARARANVFGNGRALFLPGGGRRKQQRC